MYVSPQSDELLELDVHQSLMTLATYLLLPTLALPGASGSPLLQLNACYAGYCSNLYIVAEVGEPVVIPVSTHKQVSKVPIPWHNSSILSTSTLVLVAEIDPGWHPSHYASTMLAILLAGIERSITTHMPCLYLP